MNGRIRLREPTAEDVPLLNLWDSTPDFRGEFNDFGLPPRDHSDRVEKGFVGETAGTLIIETLEGVAVGTVDWRPAVYGPPPESIAAQLGITLAPEARGKGYGPEALRLVAKYLFANTRANRIEGSCDVENVASQKALTKAGYRYEGIARGAQFRHGAYHDLILYGLVRGDSL